MVMRQRIVNPVCGISFPLWSTRCGPAPRQRARLLQAHVRCTWVLRCGRQWIGFISVCIKRFF